ncbi:MAG: DUF4175 family protein [Chitinophagales bacterium]
MESAYTLLIKKIDQFIRKYYLNKILKGSLYWVALVISAFLLLSLTEFKAYLNPTIKLPLVISFAALVTISAFIWIIRPLLSYFKLGDRISHEQAARFIGLHFTDVKDKLLNILQLRSDVSSTASKALIEASINQKSSEIQLVPFSKAIDLSGNRKYLKYALPPFLVLLAIFLGSPSVLKDSTKRLSKPTQHFEKAAPFQFVVERPDKIVQFENAVVEVKIEGQVLPYEVYINKNGKPYKMDAQQKDLFSYTFKNVDESFDFNIEANGFSSKPYNIAIIPKPTLLDAQVELQFPAYTGRTPTVARNVGELSVPVGTKATWKFNAKHTGTLTLGNEVLENKKGFFNYTTKLQNNAQYVFHLSNNELKNADSVQYSVAIIPDRYPVISAQKITDSLDATYMYFIGEYSDDYGISDLRFHFKINYDKPSKKDSIGSERLQFERNSTLGKYSHFTNAEQYNLSAGDQIEFYFEVFDNDGVHGAKAARSRIFTYKKPTKKEFKQQEEDNKDAIKSELAEAIEKVQDFAKEVEAIKEKTLEKKNLDWQDKKKLEDLMKQHEELSESMERMQQKFEENKKNQDEFKEADEDILEKQEKIEQLMDELLTDEMKEMMEKLREMMEEMEMNEMFENMEDFEFSNEDLEEKLDRMLELFKKMEFEQKMNDIASELEQLAEEQLELSKETEAGKKDSEDLAEQQEKLNEKFDDVQKEMEQLNELNKEQKSPADLDDLNQDSEDVAQDMEQSSDELKNGKQKKAGPKQKSAGEKMKQMAQKMNSMNNTMQMEQAQEDLEQLRQLLENLVKLSFDQEDLFEAVKQTETDQPKFRTLVQDQYKLKNDAAMIEDSLVALSKRVFQIESFVTEELHKMNRELKQSIENMEERRKAEAVTNQQFVMTSANNLALMLSEVMQQMQEAMAKSMPGNQQCQKPGGKGSPLPSMQEMQKQLNEQMKGMQENMSKGKGPGGKEMSKEFARMAQEQAALREALRKMKEGMSQGEKKASGVDELMEKMDQTETDLLNKRITQETLMRQEEIITNLLDMETAEREQEKEEKRESKTANQVDRKLPPEIEEYLKQRQSSVEVYKTVPPTLKPFYKKLVEKYFQTVN